MEAVEVVAVVALRAVLAAAVTILVVFGSVVFAARARVTRSAMVGRDQPTSGDGDGGVVVIVVIAVRVSNC